MKRWMIALTLCLVLPLAVASIGEPRSEVLAGLEPFNLVYTSDGDFATDTSFSVTLEERNDALYQVSAAGTLDAAGISFASTLVGVATGYGEGIAEPVAQFFEQQVGEVAGAGPINLSVEEFVLTLDVSGDEAPYDVVIGLELRETPAAAFPEAPHSLGPADATYVIREFSDLQCPACQQFAQTALPLIKEELLSRGDVRFEYHHFPLQSIHPNALPAAEAAECVVDANDADAFWTYHDALFERQRAWSNLGDPASYFVRLAADIGLSTEGMASCLDERRYADEILEDYEIAGGVLGLRGTPSVFVNGYQIRNYPELSSYLDAMRYVDLFGDE